MNDLTGGEPPASRAQGAVLALAIAACWGLLLFHFSPSLLFLDTTTAGGDTPSFHHPIEHLRDVLLPAGNPQGWDAGNFAGYAPYQYYFLPPSLAIVVLAKAMPFNVAFKLVSVAGTFLLPLTTALALRALGYSFPVPAVGAAASLLFLFNEGNTMWGGNIPSTLAGEFSFSLSFALAVLFLGLLFRGFEQRQGRRSLALLLAVVGLCHPVGFIMAAAPGLFFLLERGRFRQNFLYLAWVYGTALLLMAFWLLPLVGRIGYATSINWTWVYASWHEILPPILLPACLLAGLDVVRVTLGRAPADRAGRYLLFGLIVTAVAYANATTVGLPDVRFVPFAQFLAVLLALDLLAVFLPRLPAPALPGLALVAVSLAWVQASAEYIPDWIRWNYEGVENKPAYPTLQRICAALRGTLEDPRVAYENSRSYEVFGSMRIFESLPGLAGRATLEGVLLQTALTSPFVYYLQSLVSEQGTGVIPGYSYPSCDPLRGTARLDLFNVRDFLAVTPTVKDALDADPRWERTLHLPPYAIYRRRDCPGRYVHVPRYRPVLVETDQWKRDFHRWFASDDALEVPIVAARDVPPAERQRFPLTSRSPIELPHERVRTDCRVAEKLSPMVIEFTTNCPGLPHWIAMAYHPNWRAEGASSVFLVSPAFMLVFPEGRQVRLRFERGALDWFGLAASLLGLGLWGWPGKGLTAIAPLPSPPPSRARRMRLGLVALVAAVTLAVTGWSMARTWAPSYFYRRGWAAFVRQDDAAARWNFERVMAFGRESPQAVEAVFFRAASLLRSGDAAAAAKGYREVIEAFTDSAWVAESRYQLGLCLLQLGHKSDAEACFREVVAKHPRSTWAGLAAARLRELEGQARPGATHG
jgi:hypothetical protein